MLKLALSFPQEKSTMDDHGHLRHFAKVLDITKKEWKPTEGGNTRHLRQDFLDYLLKQEEFHRDNLSYVRGMISFLRTLED